MTFVPVTIAVTIACRRRRHQFFHCRFYLIVVFALCAHRHCRCCRPSSSSLPPSPVKTDHEEAGPVGLLPLGPTPCDPACLDPQEKTCSVLLPPPREDCIHNDNIGGRCPRTTAPSPYPHVDLPPSRCPVVADADTATMMIPCLSITRPNAVSADDDSSDPHMDAHAIFEGDAEMKTP